MKLSPVIILVALCTACSSTGNVAKKPDVSTTTYEQHAGRTLPIKERAFVTAVEVLGKKAIIAQLGEPAKADDVKLKGSNKVVASIWHYHNINTDENGQYFETTELDFIDDKVVQVVFLNNDGSEEEDQSYDIPQDQSRH
ncbi:MAG: hypothetical protein V3U89_01915 [Methylophilaceae bacterium]